MKALLIVFALCTALCTATEYPYTVTDDLGFEVTLPAEPTRVVALGWGDAEAAKRLGGGKNSGISRGCG